MLPLVMLIVLLSPSWAERTAGQDDAQASRQVIRLSCRETTTLRSVDGKDYSLEKQATYNLWPTDGYFTLNGGQTHQPLTSVDAQHFYSSQIPGRGALRQDRFDLQRLTHDGLSVVTLGSLSSLRRQKGGALKGAQVSRNGISAVRRPSTLSRRCP